MPSRSIDRLATSVPPRIVGGFLAGIALLFTLLWTAMSLAASANGTPLDTVARVVVTMDLTVQLPALFVGGILLWRRRPLGYVVAAGLLLQAVAYLVGLSMITLLQESLIQAPIDVVAVGSGFIVGAIGLVLIAPFGARRCRSDSRAGTTRQALVGWASVRVK